MYFLAQGQSVHSTEPRYQQFEDRSQYLNAIEIEAAGNVPGLEQQVRHAIAQINPDLAIVDFQTFAEQVQGNFTQQAMIAKLTSFFGILALVLASIGLYGVTAYSVERRTSEIGIRMALRIGRVSCGWFCVGHSCRWGLALQSAFRLRYWVAARCPASCLGSSRMIP
jgi:hypothetical protein